MCSYLRHMLTTEFASLLHTLDRLLYGPRRCVSHFMWCWVASDWRGSDPRDSPSFSLAPISCFPRGNFVDKMAGHPRKWLLLRGNYCFLFWCYVHSDSKNTILRDWVQQQTPGFVCRGNPIGWQPVCSPQVNMWPRKQRFGFLHPNGLQITKVVPDPCCTGWQNQSGCLQR